MKQKITNVNWAILFFAFLLEITLINIVLVTKLDISIYNEIYNLIKVNTVCIGVDLIFIFYIRDFAINKKRTKDILKTYKSDVNLRIVRMFFIIEIIKMVLVTLSLLKTIGNIKRNFYVIVTTFIVVIILYYILHQILPKTEDLKTKIKKLKQQKDLKIVLIDGDIIPSSFEIEKDTQYKIANNHLYINIKKDLPRLEEIKEFILENTIAIIHEIENANNDKIFQVYEKQEINNINMFHIIAVSNYDQINFSNKIKNINAIQVCDIDSVIEFVENLFITGEREKINEETYVQALMKIKNVKEEEIKKDEDVKDNYIEKLNIICQYNFNNKLNDKIEIIPKNDILFELYRNAYLHTSAYQSILAMFNYITVMGKMVQYYLYAKNNPKFNKNKIRNMIINDKPSVWNGQITLNIYQNPENILYKNLRETKFELSNEEKIFLHTYLSYLLNENITGENITFSGLVEIFDKFRNKVQAHGIISDANVYAVWNLTKIFAIIYNKMLKIDELEYEYKKDTGEVKIGYKGEEKVNVGKYIIWEEGNIYFIKDKGIYLNYLTGETKFVKGEEIEK